MGSTHSWREGSACARVFHLMRLWLCSILSGATIVADIARTAKPPLETFEDSRADRIRARDVRRPVRRYPVLRCLSSATVTSLTVSIAMGNHTTVTWNSGVGPAAPGGIVNGDSGLGICRRDLTSWQHRSSLYGRSLSCHRSCDFCQNFVTEAAIPSLALERHAGEERHA